MNIFYVGNFTQTHCTEVHLAATLRDLGHHVQEIQEDQCTPEQLTVLIKDPELKIDLFLFTRTWGDLVSLGHLAQLRERQIPSASYHLDLYVGLSRKYLHEIEEPDGTKRVRTLEEVLQSDPFWRTDFVFTPDGDPKSAEVFKRNGVEHHYIKPGVFKPECYIAKDNAINSVDGSKVVLGSKHPILFVGGGARPGDPDGYGHPEWPYRDELIGWLQDTYGDSFTKFGHPQETIRNAALNKLYAESKVVVGDSVCIDFRHEHYWSDRVYETIGRGGFLIHPYIKGLEEEFTDGETIVFYNYGDFEQLKRLIDYYLENDAERERIRRAGQEFVQSHATYIDRLTQMLDIVLDAEEEKVFKQATSLPIKINLGAGSEPTEGWVNVDWLEGAGIDVVHNLLVTPWPFQDGVAEEIKAIDVLEHMPNYTGDNKSTSIAFVEECHRILKTGGKLFITVPHWQSKNLWIDPTHVRGYDEKSMDYFDPDKDFGKWYGYYSPCKFTVTSVRTPNDNVQFTMVKR